DAAELTVIEVLPQALLKLLGPPFEARGREVDLEQRRGGEVADHPVDVGVKRQPIEQRQHEREARAPCPRPQDLGEGRQQQSRRSQTQASSTRLQAAPRLGLQTAVTANEALCRELARVADQRQLRARGQAVEASQPVLAGSAERLALAQGVL